LASLRGFPASDEERNAVYCTSLTWPFMKMTFMSS